MSQTNVATKVQQLLDRVANIRRGTDITKPTRFDRDGERHANQVAAADRKENRRNG